MNSSRMLTEPGFFFGVLWRPLIAFRTDRIMQIFQIRGLLQGREIHTGILDYILITHTMPPKRKTERKGETGEKDGMKGKRKQLPPMHM